LLANAFGLRENDLDIMGRVVTIEGTAWQNAVQARNAGPWRPSELLVSFRTKPPISPPAAFTDVYAANNGDHHHVTPESTAGCFCDWGTVAGFHTVPCI
jgi:hypothetical protein